MYVFCARMFEEDDKEEEEEEEEGEIKFLLLVAM